MFFENTKQAMEYGRRAGIFEIKHLKALQLIYGEKLRKQKKKGLVSEAEWNAAIETATEIQFINEALQAACEEEKSQKKMFYKKLKKSMP